MNDDSTLFNELYQKHYKLVFNYVSKVLEHKSLMNVEDIVQDTFCEAWKKWQNVKDHPNQGGWLMETAKNKLRALRRKTAGEISFDDCMEEPGLPDEGIEALENTLLMESVLTKQERELLIKFYLEGYSSKELAEQENMSEGAFKVKLYRIRKKIQQSMNQG